MFYKALTLEDQKTLFDLSDGKNWIEDLDEVMAKHEDDHWLTMQYFSIFLPGKASLGGP